MIAYTFGIVITMLLPMFVTFDRGRLTRKHIGRRQKVNGRVIFILFVSSFYPAAARAQQMNSKVSQTDAQKLGQRLFEQRCPVCHTSPTITSRRYAVTLTKDLVVGNEDGIREIIRNGIPDKMPGFKYGLEPSEIDAIIEYLKTVTTATQQGPGPKPAQTN
jgi:mono/diheme cytochrome c family protein